MKRLKWILFVLASPWDMLVTWPLVLAIRVLWGTNLHWCQGLWCELKPGSWPTRSWYRHPKGGTWGGTTLGHGGFYGPERVSPSYYLLPPEQFPKIVKHEHVHVEQFQASMLRSALVACLVAAWTPWWLTLLVWWLGGALYGLSGWLTAGLRGEPMYRGSWHEESAYGQAD